MDKANGGRELCRQEAADEQNQGVFGLGEVLGESGHVGTSGLHLGLGGTEIQLRGHSLFEAEPAQIEGCRCRSQGLLGVGQFLVQLGLMMLGGY